MPCRPVRFLMYPNAVAYNTVVRFTAYGHNGNTYRLLFFSRPGADDGRAIQMLYKRFCNTNLWFGYGFLLFSFEKEAFGCKKSDLRRSIVLLVIFIDIFIVD